LTGRAKKYTIISKMYKVLKYYISVLTGKLDSLPEFIRRRRGGLGGLIIVLFVLLSVFMLRGCRSMPQFPERPMRIQFTSDGSKVSSFDTDKDHVADYWQREDQSGRKVELRITDLKDYETEKVNLDEIDATNVPHFIIALDGVPFQLVQELYGQGCFRLFYRPSRLVSTFPAMTDLAFQQIFGGRQPIAYQAMHFDPEKNRMISGNDIYLSGEAADWAKILDYRCSFKLDAVAYIDPEMVFEHELRGMMEVFRQVQKGTAIGYSVGTAGLGTRGGREAILKYLRTVDQLCEQIVYERRGQVKITLLADHGHNMSGRGRVSFEQLLKDNGFRLRDDIETDQDVVTVSYGLVTYAAFFTKKPAEVSKVLLQDPAVTLACYPQGDEIVVQNIDGKAIIQQGPDGRFSYTSKRNDPLQLLGIIRRLQQGGKVDGQGFIDDRALFDATIKHIYPDPLRRIWRAFHGLVKEPADLIVCLDDGWVHGSKFFYTLLRGASSTHGSLNQINSTAFVITMLGELPEAMRCEEVLAELKKLQAK